jgi:hypothetical protein
MSVLIDRIDIEAIERLSDATMAAGQTETATEGYALALRLRASLGIWSTQPEGEETEPCRVVT